MASCECPVWGLTVATQVHEVSADAGRPLCRLDAIPDGGAVAVDIDSSTGGFSLILLRRGDQVFAYHNECPHAGRRLDWAPGKFLIKDGAVICAAHGATFDIPTGSVIAGPCRNGLAPVKLQVSEGIVALP
ncbi:MAG: Rieske (2Fe-2S) protein [Rhodanobacteraceae bacterium]|nr:Rieske (2Fe-2S) protein [Rhodanobacteraceae bacterium]